jgi:hypothetical protein
MKFDFPLLKDNDHSILPSRTEDGCIVCQTDFQKGLVYLSAGAVAEATLVESDLLEGFFHIGFHSNPNELNSQDVDVVNNLIGGQFDLNFCSTSCLRKFLMGLVDELEVRLRLGQPNGDAACPASDPSPT